MTLKAAYRGFVMLLGELVELDRNAARSQADLEVDLPRFFFWRRFQAASLNRTTTNTQPQILVALYL
jgi:hypothetical protein